MSVNNIIAFVAVTSFIVFGYAPTPACGDLTLEKYQGRWYVIAIMHNENSTITCESFDVVRDNNDEGIFYQLYNMLLDGKPITHKIMGEMIDSNLYITVRRDGQDHTLIYKIISFNDDEELLLVLRHRQLVHLISRKTTFSTEIKEAYESLVTPQVGTELYIDHSNCPTEAN